MKLRPLEDCLVVEEIAQGVSKGGIVLPKQALDRDTVKGKVLEMGPGKRDTDGEIWPVDLEPDAVILFDRQASRKVTLDDGSKVFVMKANAVIAEVVDDDD